jgi:flagellar protein FliJ
VARFTFKLEGVLEQRHHAERQRQREVAVAQHKLLRIQAEMDALGAVARSSAVQLRTGRLTSQLLAAHQRFDSAMRQKGTALQRQIEEARHELDAAQTALADAAKQRKVMEKLKEREQAKWSEAQQKMEAIETDEIGRRVFREADDAII